MPTFARIVPNNLIHAADVNQIIDALDGASGAGIPISITAVNDQTNFALTIQNDDPTNQRSLNVLNPAGMSMIRVDSGGVALGSPLTMPAGWTAPPGALLGYPVGGDLSGTVDNAHVHVLSGSNLDLDSATLIRWNNDNNHSINADTTNNVLHFDEYGTWQWRASSNALAVVMSLDQNGNLVTAGNASHGGNVLAGTGSGTVSASGFVRMPRHQQGYSMRNSANSGDDAIGFDGSDAFSIQGRAISSVGGSSVGDLIINVNGTQYRVNVKQ